MLCLHGLLGMFGLQIGELNMDGRSSDKFFTFLSSSCSKSVIMEVKIYE